MSRPAQRLPQIARRVAECRLFDVPASRDRRAQPIWLESGELRREATVPELRAQPEPGRAGERQFAAGEDAKADAIFLGGLYDGRQRSFQRLVMEAPEDVHGGRCRAV